MWEVIVASIPLSWAGSVPRVTMYTRSVDPVLLMMMTPPALSAPSLAMTVKGCSEGCSSVIENEITALLKLLLIN